MVSILLVSKNERERQILTMAFEQRGIKCLQVDPTYQSFMIVLQFHPDLVLMELPKSCSDQLYFASLLKKQKKTKSLPIIGYGNCTDMMEKKGYINMGVSCYLDRPLKFSKLLEIINQFLKLKNKTCEAEPQLTDKEKDFELLLNSSTSRGEKLELMTKYVSTRVAFPFTVARVLHLTQDERTGAGDLAKAITADPGITAHILKLSNSVFFASSSRRINSIKDAIVRIGFNETKKIVMSMSVIKLFDNKVEKFGFNRMEFWNHSLSCAVVSERIARQTGAVNAEEAFLTGLLHDIGMIFFDEFFSPVFQKLLENSIKNSQPLLQCEKNEIGVTHNDLVGELFPKWKLPNNLTEAILAQHMAGDWKTAQIDNSDKKLALCIFLADMISKSLKIGRECDEFVRPVSKELLISCGLGAGVNNSFVESVSGSVEMFRKFLKIEERDRQEEKCLDQKLTAGILNQRGDIFIPLDNYLRKEGWEVERFDSQAKSSSMDKKLDVLILWIDEFFEAEKIAQYEQIIHSKSDGVDIAYTPLLIVSPEELKERETERVKVISSKFDLAHMSLMLEKMAIEFFPGSSQIQKPTAQKI
ncbi:HDOD domain-containing protein [Chitinispirillum alkaliphilum]|nr:HDOD domain-containing protein [Chitinispirillum alkaliphilum]